MNESPVFKKPYLLSPLGVSAYRNLFIGNALSNLGGIIQMTAAAWLMTSIADSPDKVAWVQTSVALPVMLFAIVSGAISDNFSRRNILLVSQSFALVVSLALAVCSYFGWITPWLLLTFTFLVGCGAALTGPSWQASVGDLLSREHLPFGVLLNNISFNISRSVAPAIGGIIVASVGVTAAFVTNAVSYLFMLYPLWIWKAPKRADDFPRENLGRSIAAGLRYISMSPNISRVIFRAFVFCVGAISLLSLLPLVVRERLHGNATDYGVILGAFGLGGILGAVFSNRLRLMFSNEILARLAFTVNALCVFSVAFSERFWVVALATMGCGACWVTTLSLMNTTVQLSTPRWVVGRALSIYMTMTFTGMSLGSWMWGRLVQDYHIQTTLLIAGFVLLMGILLGFFVPLPDTEKRDLSPSGSWPIPQVKMRIRPSSGPISISVDFLIDEKDVREFLKIMRERRYIRVRDGAQQWRLMRDMQEPRRWTMNYRFPTWAEYVRHQQRMTVADADVARRIDALHRGEGKPVVRRMIERSTEPLAIKASEMDDGQRPPIVY